MEELSLFASLCLSLDLWLDFLLFIDLLVLLLKLSSRTPIDLPSRLWRSKIEDRILRAF